MGEQLISVPEAGKRLGISRWNAYHLAHRKDFPSIVIGGRILVLESELDRWILRQMAEQKGEIFDCELFDDLEQEIK